LILAAENVTIVLMKLPGHQAHGRTSAEPTTTDGTPGGRQALRSSRKAHLSNPSQAREGTAGFVAVQRGKVRHAQR
jgi:hypothetical protein